MRQVWLTTFFLVIQIKLNDISSISGDLACFPFCGLIFTVKFYKIMRNRLFFTNEIIGLLGLSAIVLNSQIRGKTGILNNSLVAILFLI